MLAQATPCRRARCPPAERKSAAAIRAQQLWRKIRAACMDILIHDSSAHSRSRNLPPSSVSTNAVPPDWEQLLRGGGCPGKFRRSSVYRDLGGLQDKQDKLTARTAKIRKNELRGLIGCRAFIYLLSEANGPLFQVATLTGFEEGNCINRQSTARNCIPTAICGEAVGGSRILEACISRFSS